MRTSAPSRLLFLCLGVVSTAHADTVAFTNFRNLDVPGDACAACAVMNAAGDLAGSFLNGSGFEKLADGSLISPIVYPPGYYTKVYGINDSGMLAGYYLNQGAHGFTYS